MEDGNPWVALLVTVVLVAINGVLASSEIALVGLNEVKLKQKKDKKSERLLEMKRDPSNFLSTIQIGITLSGLLSGAFAADSLAKPIVQWAQGAGITGGLLSAINIGSVILITLLITFFMLVFGELVPKRIAMANPEKTARKFITPIYTFSKITKPLVKLLSATTNGILKLVGVSNTDENQRVTEEEILLMLKEGREQGTIEENEMEIVTNLFAFTDSTVERAMTHRTEIQALSLSAPVSEVVELMAKTFHSRFPIYDKDIDHIVGVLYSQDIVAMYPLDRETDKIRSIKDIMREPFFVPENSNLSSLFARMKEKKDTLAIVVDEFGGTSGIITMIDIIEEILGEVEPNPYGQIVKREDGSWVLDGRTEMEDVIRYFNLQNVDDEETTISGFMVTQLGYFPQRNERASVEVENYVFQVLKMERTRIKLIKIVKRK